MDQYNKITNDCNYGACCIHLHHSQFWAQIIVGTTFFSAQNVQQPVSLNVSILSPIPLHWGTGHLLFNGRIPVFMSASHHLNKCKMDHTLLCSYYSHCYIQLHPPNSSAEVANGLELYLHLPSVTAQACHWMTSTFYIYLYNFCQYFTLSRLSQFHCNVLSVLISFL